VKDYFELPYQPSEEKEPTPPPQDTREPKLNIELPDPPALDLHVPSAFTAADSDSQSDINSDLKPVQEEKYEPMQYTDRDYDDVDSILKADAVPKLAKVPEEIEVDENQEAEQYTKLRGRLESLKWDHPITSGQDEFTVDQVFHSFSHYDNSAENGDNDAQFTNELQDTERTINKESAWEAFQEITRQWDFETTDSEETMLHDLFDNSYSSFP
jgi:hypothetical protein